LSMTIYFLSLHDALPISRRLAAELPVVGAGSDPLQDLLGGDDLVGPHHQQLAVHIEHAVAGENVQQRVLGKKGSGEAIQFSDGPDRKSTRLNSSHVKISY